MTLDYNAVGNPGKAGVRVQPGSVSIVVSYTCSMNQGCANNLSSINC